MWNSRFILKSSYYLNVHPLSIDLTPFLSRSSIWIGEGMGWLGAIVFTALFSIYTV